MNPLIPTAALKYWTIGGREKDLSLHPSHTPTRYNMHFKSLYLLNQYGQDLAPAGAILSYFEGLSEAEKNTFFYLLLHLIVQSGCTQEDVPLAIAENGLKPSYTPCVLLTNSVKMFNLEKIINLPAYEHPKVLLLFIGLFKQGYTRRFEAEKNVSHKGGTGIFGIPIR